MQTLQAMKPTKQAAMKHYYRNEFFFFIFLQVDAHRSFEIRKATWQYMKGVFFVAFVLS